MIYAILDWVENWRRISTVIDRPSVQEALRIAMELIASRLGVAVPKEPYELSNPPHDLKPIGPDRYLVHGACHELAIFVCEVMQELFPKREWRIWAAIDASHSLVASQEPDKVVICDPLWGRAYDLETLLKLLAPDGRVIIQTPSERIEQLRKCARAANE